jgi:hypothetical protein
MIELFTIHGERAELVFFVFSGTITMLVLIKFIKTLMLSKKYKINNKESIWKDFPFNL